MPKVILDKRGRMILASRIVPGCLSAFETRRGRYSFPVCGDIIRRLMNHDKELELSDELWDTLAGIHQGQMELDTIAKDDSPEGDMRLYPYQRVAVQWLATIERGILADEQGLGKTVEACCAAAQINPKRSIIICPTAMMQKWGQHVTDWIPGVRITYLGESKRKESIEDWKLRGGYLITNYDRAVIEADKLLIANLVIIDEAHKLRNRKTEMTKKITKIALKSKYLFLLTATPTVNGPEDVWTLLKMLDKARWGSFWGFIFRFCEVSDTGYGLKIDGLRDSEAPAMEAVLRPYILRRSGELGLKESEVRWIDVPLTGLQKELYEQMDESGECGGVMAYDTLAQYTRLRQLALHPGLVFPDYDGPSKLDVLPDLIRERDGQVVVFTSFAGLATKAVEVLEQAGIGASRISGDLDTKERELSLSLFKSAASRVLVVTHGTGGEGLDLTEADRAVFLDLAWNPAGNEHAEKRILRHGQLSDRTEIIHLHSPGTIEDDVREIVEQKRPATIAEISARRASHI